MNLKETIVEILKRGEKFRARVIADRASMLNGGEYISVDKVKEIMFNDLKGIVKYDKNTYEYYIVKSKGCHTPSTTNEFIIDTLKHNTEPMSAMDIVNYIRLKYKKAIHMDNVTFAILTELKYDVGITDGRTTKYFLF